MSEKWAISAALVPCRRVQRCVHSGFGPPLVVSAGYSIAPAAPFRTHSDESGTPAAPSADHCRKRILWRKRTEPPGADAGEMSECTRERCYRSGVTAWRKMDRSGKVTDAGEAEKMRMHEKMRKTPNGEKSASGEKSKKCGKAEKSEKLEKSEKRKI